MKLTNAIKSAVPAAVLGFLALASTSALALTTNTSTFTVGATVGASCSVSASNLAFGPYIGAAVQVSTPLTVQCSAASTTYNIGLSQGGYTGGSLTNRQMGPTATPTAGGLLYTLTSVSYTGTNWGNSSLTNWVTGTSSPTALTTTTQTVYGTLPANQVVAQGVYGDTITASITY
jgi:spore coat protein U-like protein